MAQNNNNLLVARALASSVKTLLGPQHSLKCCTSDGDGDAVICSSASKLLQFIDIQHPAGFIINDACQGQYKKYKTNCKTLVCMAGFWSKAAQDLQDQGVPVPVIVRLFDDALEVCEEVCQELSFPLTEALQSHDNSDPPAKNPDTQIADKEATSSAMEQYCLADESDKFGVVGDDDDDDDDDGHNDNDDDNDNDDISWYFDGHIPEPDGHIPGTGDHAFRVYGHIPDINSHIPGVPGYIPGIINMEATDESYFPMDLLQSVLPETKSSNKTEDLSTNDDRSGCVTSNEKTHESVLSGAKYSELANGLGDANVLVTQIASFSVNTESPDMLQKTTNECVFSVEQEHGKSSSSLRKTCYKKSSSSPSELMEYTDRTLSSGKEYDNEEEDEFEASFLEAVSNSAKENLQSCPQGFPFRHASGTELETLGSEITKLSVAEEHKDFSVARAKLVTVDAQEKEKDTKVQSESKSSRTVNKKLTNSKDISSSGANEKEITDKLLLRLSEKLDSKNKGVEKQVKLSEIYKGSRHFINSSMEGTISTPSSSKNTSANKLNQTADILFKEECLTTNEMRYTSKASLQSSLKPGQVGTLNLDHSTPLTKILSAEKCETFSTSKTSVRCSTSLRKKLSCENTYSSVTALHSKDESTFMDRNKELLTQLGDRLAHGKQQEMKLAIEVIDSLFRSSDKTLLEEFEIHLNIIHTELILGPPVSFSQTVDGLLLESTAAFQFSSILPGSQISIALVNGDITSEFRHTGLNNELPIHRIIENKEEFKLSKFNREEYWYQRVIRTLSDNKIGVLAAKGVVQDSILDYCLSHNIVVLQNVAYPTLQLLSFATGSVLVTYLADLREQDVGRPVTIETWELGWTPSVVRLRKRKASDSCDVRAMNTCQYLLVKEVNRENGSCEEFNSPLQTVLLCGPCKDLLCEAEENFWNSIHSIKNALACGRVLPGAGAPEIACIRRLTELAEERNEPKMSPNSLSGWLQESLELFRPLVYTAFAQGFKECLGNILFNSGRLTTPCGISTYLEQLINTEFSLAFIGSFREESSVDNCHELQVDAENTLGLSRTRAANIPTRDPTRNSKSRLDDPFHSGKLSLKAESLVWDDYTAKKEAWKRAVGTVRILLQSDVLIETGLECSSKQADFF